MQEMKVSIWNHLFEIVVQYWNHIIKGFELVTRKCTVKCILYQVSISFQQQLNILQQIIQFNTCWFLAKHFLVVKNNNAFTIELGHDNIRYTVFLNMLKAESKIWQVCLDLTEYNGLPDSPMSPKYIEQNTSIYCKCSTALKCPIWMNCGPIRGDNIVDVCLPINVQCEMLL